MTSKIENKIIIDGVDVSKCRYYRCKGCTANNFGKCDSSSEIYKNCYFKQLKRTELAFENLKRRGTIPMVFIDSKLIDKYKQALEETLKILCNGRTFYEGYFDTPILSRTDKAIKVIKEVIE